MPDIVAPIIPNIRADPTIFITAFQQALANSRKQQQLELALQRVNQQHEMAVEKMDFAERMGAWRHEKDMDSVRQGQERIDDMARYHRDELAIRDLDEKRRDLVTETKLKEAQSHAQDSIDYTKEVNGIPYQRGTQEWQNAYHVIENKFASYLNTPDGGRSSREIFDSADKSQKFLNANRKALMQDYTDSVSKAGIHPNLATAKYYAANEDLWGKNDDGSRFLVTKQVKDPATGSISIQIVDPSEAKKLSTADQKTQGYRFTTIPKAKWENWTKMRSAIGNMLPGADDEPAPSPNPDKPTFTRGPNGELIPSQ